MTSRRGARTRQPALRERVAAGLGDHLVADPRVKWPGEHRVQQRPGIGLPQALDHQFRQSRQPVDGNPGREDHTYRLRFQAARHERQRLRRCAIQPLLVIHQADQRLFLGHVGQQAQHRQADEKAVWRRPGTDAERGPQRLTLRDRETLDDIQHWRAQLVQRGERELHLRLDTRGTCDTASRRSGRHVVQQGRLAQARLADHYQPTTLTCANSINQPVKHVAFAAPARQPRGAS